MQRIKMLSLMLSMIGVALGCWPIVAEAQTCPDTAVTTVTLDHQTGTLSPDGLMTLARMDTFCVNVINTDPTCYLYNFQEVVESARVASLGVPPNVVFSVIHDGETDAYEIEITRKTSCTDESLPAPLSRTIRVETYGWALGFAGAYTVDDLTDPEFFLEPGTRIKPGTEMEMMEMEEGFFVRHRSAADSSWERGAATMIHLYHNDEARFGFFHHNVHWVPISLGLGVAGDSEDKYFVGTGLRFGTKAFLTVGAVFGDEKRLPNRFAEGDFTTEANALDTLPTRTDDAFFFSLSYSFADLDVNRLSSRFKTQQPAAPASTP